MPSDVITPNPVDTADIMSGALSQLKSNESMRPQTSQSKQRSKTPNRISIGPRMNSSLEQSYRVAPQIDQLRQEKNSYTMSIVPSQHTQNQSANFIQASISSNQKSGKQSNMRNNNLFNKYLRGTALASGKDITLQSQNNKMQIEQMLPSEPKWSGIHLASSYRKKTGSSSRKKSNHSSQRNCIPVNEQSMVSSQTYTFASSKISTSKVGRKKKE